MKKHHDLTFAEWDKKLNWQYKRDWQRAAESLGYTYITEFLVSAHQKNLPLSEIAQIVGVTVSAISRRFKQLGIKPRSVGGRNNQHNATGLFYFKPREFPRRYFVAGRVKIVGEAYFYYTFRCTRCNQILCDDEWIDHKECFRLIHKHLSYGECKSFKPTFNG